MVIKLFLRIFGFAITMNFCYKNIIYHLKTSLNVFSSNKILQINNDSPHGNHFKEKKRKTNQPTKLDIRKYD
jgi:hypothetical protein